MIDKFQAAMLGFAIGDALAAPIEDLVPEPGLPRKLTTDYVKAGPSHPLAHLELGQYSDETQVMLLVAESLVANRAFNVEDLSHRFIDWFQSQKLRALWRFPSNTMMKACRKMASGVHWTQAGFPSAGVIASARIVPLALGLWRQQILLKDAIEKSCKITHTDPKVVAGGLILASAIKMGLEGSEPAPDVLVNAAIDRAQAYSPEVVKRLKTVRESLKMDPGPANQVIGSSGYCLEAVPAAIFWFLRHPKRFDDLMVATANLGGDSDAIAAMAGAVFGAFNGLGAISERWLKPLENVDKIKQLGCDLYRLATPQR